MFSLYKTLRVDRRSHFACVFLFIAFFTAANAQSLQTVSRVIDGDTLVLQGGETVRLLGINAPEVAHYGHVAEEGGLLAKRYLQKLLVQHQVYLEYDVEQTDHYKRSLAYVFLDNGLHVNIELLKNGMAILSLHPPNIKYARVLSIAQQYAEIRKLGVWSQVSHQPKLFTIQTARQLKNKWGRFNSRVKSIQYTKKGAKLYVSKRCYIWIPVSNYHYFTALESYLGREIEVRAWLKKWGREWSMRVIHPSQIILKPNGHQTIIRSLTID